MLKSPPIDDAPSAQERTIWRSRRALVAASVIMGILFAWVVWNAGKREFRLLHNSVPFTTAEVIYLNYSLMGLTGDRNIPALRVSPHAWTVHPDKDGVVRLPWKSPSASPRDGMLLVITNHASEAMTEFQWNEDLRRLDLVDAGWQITTRFRFFGFPIGTKTTLLPLPQGASPPSP